MNDIVIRAEHVSKLYRLGVINHGTLYRDLQSWWAKWRNLPDPNISVSDYASDKRKQSRLKGDIFHDYEVVDRFQPAGTFGLVTPPPLQELKRWGIGVTPAPQHEWPYVGWFLEKLEV